MVRATRPLVAALLLLTAACLNAPIETSSDAAAGANGNGNGNGNGEECTLADGSLEPGTFESDVLPGLEDSCTGAACHDPGVEQGDYGVFGGAYLSPDAAEHCDFVDSIESFVEFADRDDPSQSPMILVLDDPAHTGGTWSADQPPRPSIEAYLEAIAGGGGAPGLDEFEAEIQPIFDEAGGQGCALGGACHQNGAGGFTLISEPAAGSADMRANYDAAVAQANPAAPESSALVERATTTHFGSPEVSDAERQSIVDWIATLSE